MIDLVKEKVRAAMKARKLVEREVLGVLLGELQTVEARQGSLSEDEALGIVRKLVKSNEETLQLASDPEQQARLREEIQLLRALLPQTLDVDAIIAELEAVRQAVVDAKNDGQATGVAMKHLKSVGAAVEGKQVAAAVKKLRSS